MNEHFNREKASLEIEEQFREVAGDFAFAEWLRTSSKHESVHRSDDRRNMRNAVKLKSKDTEALQEFLERLRQVLGINLIEVKLFGSKATGKDQGDSDIDVLVAVENGGVEIEDQVLEIAFDVNLKHDVYVSPRVIDRATLSDPVWSITPFLRAIAKEGVSL